MGVVSGLEAPNTLKDGKPEKRKGSRQRGIRAIDYFALGNTIDEVMALTGMSRSWTRKFREKYSRVIKERRAEMTAELSMKGLRPLKAAHKVTMAALERTDENGAPVVDAHAMRAVELVYDRAEPAVKAVAVAHKVEIVPVDLSRYLRAVEVKGAEGGEGEGKELV